MDCMSYVIGFVFFFFKQKTAYEMRISDWSSDVCSSDLVVHHPGDDLAVALDGDRDREIGDAVQEVGRAVERIDDPARAGLRAGRLAALLHQEARSEEHTSELQSLMRNSYAVFCLKTKTPQNTHPYNNNTHNHAQ